jgi:type I restriction enzyme S subunit
MLNLNTEILGRLPLRLPPLYEQRKIASILSSMGDTIEKTQSVIDQLTVVKKGVLTELLTRGMSGRHTAFRETEIGLVPAKWHVAKIREICSLASGGTPSRANPSFWNGGIPWVKTGEIDYRDIYETEEQITATALAESAAKLLPPGTLLMAMYGQGVTRGRVAMLAIEAAVNQACLAFLPSQVIRNRFLFYWLTLRYEALRSIGNETTQKNLSAAVVGDLLVPVPSLEEQEEIVTILQVLDGRFESEGRTLDALGELKRALVHSLLSGIIRVSVQMQEVA